MIEFRFLRSEAPVPPGSRNNALINFSCSAFCFPVFFIQKDANIALVDSRNEQIRECIHRVTTRLRTVHFPSPLTRKWRRTESSEDGSLRLTVPRDAGSAQWHRRPRAIVTFVTVSAVLSHYKEKELCAAVTYQARQNAVRGSAQSTLCFTNPRLKAALALLE